MLTFSEILPTSIDLSCNGFLDAMSGILDMRLGDELNADITADGSSLTIRYDEEHDAIGMRLITSDNRKMTVQYDVVYDNEGKNILFKEYKTASEDSDFLVEVSEEVPEIISKSILSGIIRDDNGVGISAEPYLMDKATLPVMHAVLSDIKNCHIPLVYLSRTMDGVIPVDYMRVASTLKNLAIVVYEPKDIQERHELINDGDIGICFPDGKKAMISRTESGYQDEFFKKLRNVVLQWHLSRVFPSHLTFDSILLNCELGKINESSVNKHDYESALRRVKELTEKNMQLSGRVDSLEYELKSLRETLDYSKQRPVICYGKEKDMFNGEIKDFVLMAIESMVNNCAEGTRRYDVLKDVLESNNFQHIHDERREIIKQALKGYNYAFTGSLQQTFNSLGISVERDGKHYKLTPYGNEKYRTVLAGTPSDVRAGKNMAGIINNLLN